MKTGMIQRLIDLIYSCTEQLRVHISMGELESLAVMIHKAMTLQTRHFHTLEHVFSFSSSGDPIQSLAALYHDIVYYQVDMGFLPEIKAIIAPYILEHEHVFWISTEPYPYDRLFTISLELFDYRPGQELSPNNGLNEFASALVMNKTLEAIVAERDLVKMNVCVEATIPFRGVDERGLSHFNLLEERLRKVSQTYQCDFTAEEIENIIRMAVTFSNKDVENFAELNAGRFLDNTWKLLPETNVALRSRNIYTIREYRQALQKTGLFFKVLNVQNIFNRYKGYPPEKEFNQIVSQARSNISLAREYLAIKLIAQAVLEALADLTGGDAPLSLFMGEIVDRGEKVKRIEHFLPKISPERYVPHKQVLLELLDTGRAGESVFDLRNSPVSLYIYLQTEDHEINRLVDLAFQMFHKALEPQDFLDEIDGQVVADIARACAMMVFTRREKLLNYANLRSP